jgi:hypothetical protein
MDNPLASWYDVTRAEVELGNLSATLRVVFDYELHRNGRAELRELLSHEPDYDARDLYRAISLLVPSNASGEELSNAIAKVVQVLDRRLFNDALWWERICALKQFDELTSADRVH